MRKILRSILSALRAFGNPPVMTDTVFCTLEPRPQGRSTVWLHYQNKPSEPVELSIPVPDFGAYVADCIRRGESYAPETPKDHIHHWKDRRGKRRIFVNGVEVFRCIFADTQRGFVECKSEDWRSTIVHNGLVTVEFINSTSKG